jgi:hypothetical protein
MNAIPLRTFAIPACLIASALALTGCGGTDRRHSMVATATTSVPASIELRSEISAGTIHFPRGLYLLESEDPRGYYYRAPVKLYQRSFSGGLPFEGGIFVSKRDLRKLRGYVIMPGGLTHVGNLSGAHYEFRY